MADFAGRQIGQLSGGSSSACSSPARWLWKPTSTSWTSPFACVDAATERAIRSPAMQEVDARRAGA
jgi:hypothetical protein